MEMYEYDDMGQTENWYEKFNVPPKLRDFLEHTKRAVLLPMVDDDTDLSPEDNNLLFVVVNFYLDVIERALRVARSVMESVEGDASKLDPDDWKKIAIACDLMHNGLDGSIGTLMARPSIRVFDGNEDAHLLMWLDVLHRIAEGIDLEPVMRVFDRYAKKRTEDLIRDLAEHQLHERRN